MRKIWSFVFLLEILISCSKVEKSANKEITKADVENATAPQKTEAVVKKNNFVRTQPELSNELLKKKIEIDTLFNQQKNIILFAKLPNKKDLVKVVNFQWPEETEISYNVLVNAKDKIIRISESPASESGDWEIWYSHYFNNEGKTFAYERYVGAFNTFCLKDEYFDLATKEYVTKIYSPQFAMIDSIYKMVDENNIDITNKKCTQEVSSEDRVFSQLSEYMNKSNLKL